MRWIWVSSRSTQVTYSAIGSGAGTRSNPSRPRSSTVRSTSSGLSSSETWWSTGGSIARSGAQAKNEIGTIAATAIAVDHATAPAEIRRSSP